MNFDEEAKNWDTDKKVKRAKVVAQEIINSIEIDKKYSAMEFGCGTGLVSFNIYDKFKKVTLIDSSKGMIDVLNSKIKEHKIDNMFGKHLDLCNGDSMDESFDVIYTSMALHHIEDIKDIVKKLYELLNDDGYLCIVDLNEEDGSFHGDHHDFHGHNGFKQEKLKKVLEDAGFRKVESNTFYHDIKVVEGKKVNYSLFLMVARK